MQTDTSSARSRRRAVTLAGIFVIVTVLTSSGPGVTLTAVPSAVDVVTYHNDNARTGQNLNETILTPANVNATTFGKIGFFPLDGKVDAQPLLLFGVAIPGQGVHDVLYAATEHGTVYGLDAATGAVLWSRSLLGAGESPSDQLGCGQVVPEIGITATPVISRSAGPNGVIYVVAMSKSGSAYFQRLHALDVTTGAEVLGGPTTVSAPGFAPRQYEERAALLLLNGMVILSWTSHCDIDPYNGWIMSYNASTLAQISALNTTPNGSRGAYWMAGAGPAADAAGNVYLLAGNGTFDTTLNSSGFPNQGNFGNAFIKLSVSPTLSVADYFSTWNTVAQSNADTDLGSGGTLVLPDLLDVNSQVRHLAVGAGKDGHIYLANRDSMGKFHASPPDNSHIYQDVAGALSGSVFSMPAYFNGTLYYGAVGNPLRAFAIVNARIVATPTSSTTRSFTYPGTTPGISASGTANAIVWAVENSDPAVLHAYEAQNLSHELYNSNQAAGSRDAFGAGNKFITPTIVNGRVYVGTTNGVAAFGLIGVTPPTTVTGTAGAIGPTGATLAGTANPNGSATTASFQYGTTTSYGGATPDQALGSGNSAVAIGGGTVTGLTCGTLYHFRAIATNAGGTASGSDATFTTSACAPTVVTGAATAVGRTGATLNGTANPHGVATTGRFEYGLTASYGSMTPPQALGSGSAAVSIGGGTIGGLACNRLYHFRAIASSSAGSTAGADQTFTTAACINGLLSVFWRNGSSGENIGWQMNGLTVASSGFLPTIADTNWQVKDVGDFDGDGKGDVVWRNVTTGQDIGWLMNGLTVAASAFLPTIADTNWQIVAVADFDGDGNADVLLRSAVSGQNVGWLMNGLTVTSSAFLPTIADTNWEVAGAGDLNGDGKADVLLRNKATGQNIGWLMNGLTVATSAFLPTIADTNWHIIGIGDLNGDGQADVLLRNSANGQDIGWLMNGLTVASSAFLPTIADTNWEIKAIGDVNADGRADVILRNKVSGQNIGWLMNGLAVTNSAFLPTIADTNWQIVGPR